MLKKKLLTDKSGALYDEYIDQAAKELAKEIDAEVLRGIFIGSGWHEVVLQPMTFEQGDAIDLWVHKTIKGNHWTHGLVWLFEDEKEANWFKIRWL